MAVARAQPNWASDHGIECPLCEVEMPSGEFSSTSLSDAIDAQHLGGQVVDGLELVAIGRECSVGRARTATVIASTEPGIPGLAEYLDQAKEGEFLVLGWNAPGPASVFGGLAGTRAIRQGCQGLIVDGWVRDVHDLAAEPLIIWARGRTPRSGKARLAVTGIAEPTSVQGVTITNGDLIVADSTGVVVVAVADADAAIAAAKELERLDAEFLQVLESGLEFQHAYDMTNTM